VCLRVWMPPHAKGTWSTPWGGAKGSTTTCTYAAEGDRSLIGASVSATRSKMPRSLGTQSSPEDHSDELMLAEFAPVDDAHAICDLLLEIVERL